MRQYRYNLDTQQAKHFAGLKSGDEFVIVVPLKAGVNYEGCITTGSEWTDEICKDCNTTNCVRNPMNMPYPIGARVGLRETWYKCLNLGSHDDVYMYKSDYPDMFIDDTHSLWRSAQCAPFDAIRYWGIVTDARVCRILQVLHSEIRLMGFTDKISEYHQWVKKRYGKNAWLKNLWVEVVTMRKE